MYCYGSSFHANRFRLASASLPSTSSSAATFTMPSNHANIIAEKVRKAKLTNKKAEIALKIISLQASFNEIQS
jgi:hypothetical protein